MIDVGCDYVRRSDEHNQERKPESEPESELE